MAKKSAAIRRQEKQDPEDLHKVFFQQTLSDPRRGGVFLREHLPMDEALRLSPADAIPDHPEFVDEDLRQGLAVLRMPPGDGNATQPYFVCSLNTGADERRGTLQLLRLFLYCIAFIKEGYQQRAKEYEQGRSDPEQPWSPPARMGIPLIVHSGATPYSLGLELPPVTVKLSLCPLHFTALLVDLRTIEDQDLSADPVLRARLRAQKHATDPDLPRNNQKLDRLLDGVDDLPQPHARDIMDFLASVAGGRARVQQSLRRIAAKTSRKTLARAHQAEQQARKA